MFWRDIGVRGFEREGARDCGFRGLEREREREILDGRCLNVYRERKREKLGDGGLDERERKGTRVL